MFSNVADHISRASGVEKLQGFNVAEFFSAVFRRYSDDDIEDQFVVGTKSSTPALSDVSVEWPKPWAFSRLLVASLACLAAFWWALWRFENPNLLPGWILTGSFAVPISVLVFFLEVNVLKNISAYRVIKLLAAGGILGMILSLFLFEMSTSLAWIGAAIAGPIEETGKLLAVVYFTRKWRTPWILNGLLCGAAVGTGFSAFESAGYVLVELIQDAVVKDGTSAEMVMLLRGTLSPFTHILWTAIAAGALWRVKGEAAFQWSMLHDPRFLRIFMFPVVLHMIWNSPLTVPFIGGLTGDLLKCLLIGLCGWYIVLMLVQEGLKEVQRAQQRSVAEIS